MRSDATKLEPYGGVIFTLAVHVPWTGIDALQVVESIENTLAFGPTIDAESVVAAVSSFVIVNVNGSLGVPAGRSPKSHAPGEKIRRALRTTAWPISVALATCGPITSSDAERVSAATGANSTRTLQVALAASCGGQSLNVTAKSAAAAPLTVTLAISTATAETLRTTKLWLGLLDAPI